MAYEFVLYNKRRPGCIYYAEPAGTTERGLSRAHLGWLAAITEAEEDDDVKVIVFKGAGRAFSAGADLTGVGFVYGMKEPKPGEKGELRRNPQRVKLKFDRALFLDFHRSVLYCTKITIAQMHEYCLGVAFQLVLHCDFSHS